MSMSDEYKQKSLTLTEKHIEVADTMGLNLSKYLRNKLEEDFPGQFED